MGKENVNIVIKYSVFSFLVFIDVVASSSEENFKDRHPTVFSYK